MNVPRRHWLAIAAIHCCCLLVARDLFAALGILTTSSNSVSIPISITDYNVSTGAAQVTKTSAHTITVVSNLLPWTVSVRALSGSFSFAPSLGDANPNKPASSLAVRAPAISATWIPLSTTSQVLGTGPQSFANQTKSLDYQINSNLATDPPGTYSLAVIYTLTTP